MSKKIRNLTPLFTKREKRKLVAGNKRLNPALFKSNQNVKLQSFAKAWLAVVKQSSENERQTYQSFLKDLLTEVFSYAVFNGQLGDYAFERSNTNRFHDAVAGEINNSKVRSKYTTAFEIKEKSSNLDLDRNDKGETAFDQVVNTASGNPFLRQIILSNLSEIRIHLPYYGSSYCERFSLEGLADSENTELRDFFICFFAPGVLISSELSEERKLQHDCITASRDNEKKQINLLFDTYIDALNLATVQITKINSTVDPIYARQMSALLVNRFLFASYANQSGYLDLSIIAMLKDEKIKTFEKLFMAMDKGGDIDGQLIFCFNGGLFSRNEDIDELEISPSLRKILLGLCEIDLEELNPSILGRIFERSLSASLADIPNSPSESHQMGAVYTPNDLAAAMVKHAFEVVGIDRSDTVRVLDPSCGSGVFLLESLKFILRNPELRTSKKIEKILSSQISGWDINPAAIELSRFMIWQYVIDLDLPLPTIKNNIHVGDALLHDFPNYKLKPDIVIGNPPFIAHQNMKKAYKAQLEAIYKTTLDPTEQYDIYVAFFDMALKRVAPKGVVSFIAPNQLAFRPYAQNLRSHILSNLRMNRIVDLTEINVFDKSVCPFVYIIENAKSESETFDVFTNIRERSGIVDAFEMSPIQTDRVAIKHLPEIEYLARGKIPKIVGNGSSTIENYRAPGKVISLSSYVERPSRGKVAKDRNGRLTVSVVTSKIEEGHPAIKKVKMSRENFDAASIRYGEKKLAMPRFFKSQVIADVFDKETFVEDNVYYVLESELKKEFCDNLEVVSGLLNSRIISLMDYVRRGLDRINSLGFRAIDAEKFLTIHVPNLNKSKQKTFLSLYDKAKRNLVHSDSPQFYESGARTAKSRLKTVVNFELFLAKELGLDMNETEVQELLQWWATRRLNFGQDDIEELIAS